MFQHHPSLLNDGKSVKTGQNVSASRLHQTRCSKQSNDQCLYLGVNAFSTKVLVDDHIFTSAADDRTTISTQPYKRQESLVICSAKAVSSFLSNSKTLAIGLALRISHFAVQHSTDLANFAAITNHGNTKKSLTFSFQSQYHEEKCFFPKL